VLQYRADVRPAQPSRVIHVCASDFERVVCDRSVQACVYDFRIHDNIAPDGAAIYAQGVENLDADVALNRFGFYPDYPCGPNLPPVRAYV
jgi:hypothetical protein